jgi:hypothetical protein
VIQIKAYDLQEILLLVAVPAGHWQTNVPREIYQELVPNANLATHPGY